MSYAHWWVRRAILEAIDRHTGRGSGSHAPTVSLDEPLGPGTMGTLEDVLADCRTPSPDERLARERLRGALEASLSDLPRREAEVVRRYFGLGGEATEGLVEIGRSLDVSRERARQMKDRGLARLRAHAGRHDLGAFRRPSNQRFRTVLSGQTPD